jgi:VWFA-related protein
MHRRWVVTLAVLCGLAASVVAQPQRQTVFRTETNYVEIDAVVTDDAGQFVAGLTAADFEVREQRQRQSIEAFTVIDLPIGAAPASTPPAPVRFRPDLTPAERVDADRIYLIYLNGASQTMVRQRALEFVRDYLQPRDIAAIWDAESPSPRLVFTNDKTVLLSELTRAVSGDARGLPSGERGRVEAQRLRDAIDWLSALQGRRKSLILFTHGWGTTSTTEVDQQTREREVTEWLQGRRPGVTTGGTWLNPTDITEQSDVHIYSYDARGLVAGVPPSPLMPRTQYETTGDSLAASARAESRSASILRSIADQTGGRAFVESNDYRQGFARIVDDNSRYYILGYYSPNTTRDGVFRAVDVRVSRPGLKVRARNGYIAR